MSLPVLIKNLKLEGTASSHQADCRFGPHAGSQCLSNCVVYLASSFFNNDTPITSTHGLDKVLADGALVDAVIRDTGILATGQYAQLHHIPSQIKHPDWQCFIYKSEEKFGFVGMESEIKEPCISSLKDILSKNYAGTVQYFLSISLEKSQAIIIKDKKIFLFDPHCLTSIPNSPAHVLSSSSPLDIVSHIAPPNTEYTGCFLYIVPHNYVGPDQFIINQYKVVNFEELHGPSIDLVDVANEESCENTEKNMLEELPIPIDENELTGQSIGELSSDQLYSIVPLSPTLLSSSEAPIVLDSNETTEHHYNKALPDFQGNLPVADPQDKPKSLKTKPQKHYKGSSNTPYAKPPKPKGPKQPPVNPNISGSDTDSDETTIDDIFIHSEPSEPLNPSPAQTPTEFTQPEQNKLPVLQSTAETANSTHSVSNGSSCLIKSSETVKLVNLLHDVKRKRSEGGYQIREFIDSDSSSIGEPSKKRLFIGESTPQDEEIWIDDEIIPVSDSESVATDESDLQSLFPESENLEQDTDGFYTDNVIGGVEKIKGLFIDGLTKVETQILSLSNFGHFVGMPLIIDPSINFPYRESVALHAMDKMLTLLIIERGLVTGTQSKFKNLLNYFILWSQKLATPTSDIQQFLNSNLNIYNVIKLLESNTLSNEHFIDHLLSKIQHCLPLLHEYEKPNQKAFIQKLTREHQAIEFADNVIHPSDLLKKLLLFVPDHQYLICTQEEKEVLEQLTDSLISSVHERNNIINKESHFFASLLTSITNFQPPPTPVVPLETQLQEKTETLETKLQDIVSELSAQVFETLQDLTATEDSILCSPDLSGILKHINTTIENVNFITENVNISTEKIKKLRYQLLFIGGELSIAFRQPWNFDMVEDIPDNAFVTNLKTLTSKLHQRQKNRAQLTQILDEVESILTNLQTDSSSPSLLTSIPLLENYMTNAGSLVTHQDVERFGQLTTLLQSLTSSESFLRELLAKVRIASLNEDLAKIQDVLKVNSSLKHNPTIKQAFLSTTSTLLHELNEAIKVRDYNVVTEDLLNLIEIFLGISEIQEGKTLIQSYNTLLQAQKEPIEKNKNWQEVLQKLDTLKSQVTQADFDKDYKKNLSNLIKQEIVRVHKIMDTELTLDWKGKVASFNPLTVNDIENFINTAPTPRLRQYTRRKLKAQIEQLENQQTKMEVVPTEVSTPALKLPKANESADRVWQKIQSAFRDLHFEQITSDDWLSLSTEYERPSSQFPFKITPTLSDLLLTIKKKIDDILINKLTSLLQQTPFVPPPFDWITPFEVNVLFYLKTIKIPSLNAIAQSICNSISSLKQAIQSIDPRGATIGTELETPIKNYLEYFRNMKTIHDDFLMGIKTDVDNYLENIRVSGSEYTTNKPTLIAMKSIMESLGISLDLPQFLTDLLKQHEKILIADQQSQIGHLENSLNTQEASILASEKEIDDQMITILKSLHTTAPPPIAVIPIQGPAVQYLQKLTQNKNILELELYSVTLDCLVWMETACKSLMTIGHKRQHKLFSQLHESILHKKEFILKQCNLESSANSSDDVIVLSTAIQELEANRIHGKHKTIKNWEDKIQQIKSLLQNTEKAGLLLAEYDNIASQSLNTLCSHHLIDNQKKIQNILNECKTTQVEDLVAKSTELLNYVKFKISFLEYFEKNQPQIFQTFPLYDQIAIPNYLHSIYNNKKRLQYIFSILYDTFGSQPWLEITPTIDPIQPSYIPIKKGPPAHRVPLFDNFLIALAYTLNSTNIGSMNITGPIKGPINKKLGPDLFAMLQSQWSDISKNANNILQSLLGPNGSFFPQQNQFTSLLLYIHSLTMALPSLKEVVSSHENSGNLFLLSHQQQICLFATIFPHSVSAALSRPSLHAAIKFHLGLISSIRPHLQDLWIENYLDKTVPDKLAQLKPQAFLFSTHHWTPMPISTLWWETPTFLELSDNNLYIARISFITWAIQTLNPVILQQLWLTFRPRKLENITYLQFISSLVWKESHLINMPTSTPSGHDPPYVYGTPTGMAIIPPFSSTKSSNSNPKITIFEAILGCLIQNTPCEIFYKSDFGETEDGEKMFILTPVFQCVSSSAVYNAMATAPRKTAPDFNSITSFSPPDEIQIFYRQFMWLQAKLSTSTQPPQYKHLILITSHDNYLDAAYVYTPEVSPVTTLPKIVPSSEITWPNEITSVGSMWSILPDSNETKDILLTTKDRLPQTSAKVLLTTPVWNNTSTLITDPPHPTYVVPTFSTSTPIESKQVANNPARNLSKLPEVQSGQILYEFENLPIKRTASQIEPNSSNVSWQEEKHMADPSARPTYSFSPMKLTIPSKSSDVQPEGFIPSIKTDPIIQPRPTISVKVDTVAQPILDYTQQTVSLPTNYPTVSPITKDPQDIPIHVRVSSAYQSKKPMSSTPPVTLNSTLAIVPTITKTTHVTANLNYSLTSPTSTTDKVKTEAILPVPQIQDSPNPKINVHLNKNIVPHAQDDKTTPDVDLPKFNQNLFLPNEVQTETLPLHNPKLVISGPLTLTDLPSIKVHYPKAKDFLLNVPSLSDIRPDPAAIMSEPVPDITKVILDINEAKNILLHLITTIREKLTLASQTIAQTVQRIKAIYLT